MLRFSSRILSSRRSIISGDCAACRKFFLVPDFTPAFGGGFGFPLLHGGCGKDKIDPRLPRLTDVGAISADAVSDGGVEAHGVGR